jgi:CelD/BcsL family acetyltransferase involved in cellulose biosynthesis
MTALGFHGHPAGGVAGAACPFQAVAVEVVDTVEGFAALRDAWDGLFERSALPHQVFQTHAFLTHWIEHYLDHSMRLSIVVGRRDGQLAMVWPLVARKRFGVTVLRVMGQPVGQFGDILVDRDDPGGALLARGWAAVRALGADLFVAGRVRADAVLARPADGIAPTVLERLAAPFADLSVRVQQDGPGPAYSARDRSSYRRRLRRLAETGALQLGARLPGREAAALALKAVAFKRAALASDGIVSPVVSDPRFAAFFADCAADPASQLRISTIASDGEPLGIDLSFDCKGSSFGHVIATDPTREKDGIGSLLVHHVFAAASERGSTVFDMLAPADEYKLRHADGQTAVNVTAYVFTPLGRLYCDVGIRRIRPLVRTLARRLPQPLVKLIAGRS